MINFPELNKVEDVAVYPRVSSDDQQERETIQSQIEFAIKYCDLHGLNIVDWYKDDGVTGTIPLADRPEGQRLLEDAKAGKFKTVLIYNMKRLGRKARITLDAIYQLEEYGVTIKSMTEPFDTSTPMGRFVITLLAGQAEFDRDTLVETLWHGANRHARLGKWLGGIVPYGYRVDAEGFLEVNEDPLPGNEDLSEAGVVRLVYHLIADQKMTTIQVADYLNALNIPPSYVVNKRKVKDRGKRKVNTAGIWYPGRVGSIIKNSTYKGIHDYGKRSKKDREIIRREVPAIVSETVWDVAQETLRENQLEGVRNATRKYLLRGIIKCGCCGRTYVGTSYSTGSKSSDGSRPMKAFYVCTGKSAYKGPSHEKCRSKNIPGEWIEEMVWAECVNFILNPGDAIKELQEGMNVKRSLRNEYFHEIDLVVKSLEDKENERQSILSLYRQKMITAADVEKQLQEIMEESMNLEKRIKQLNALLNADELVTVQFRNAEKLLLDFRSKIDKDPSYETKRQIVKTLVNKITVYTIQPPDGSPQKRKAEVKVQYSFESPKGTDDTLVRADFLEASRRSRAVPAAPIG
ncbi:recombinase family protein [Paenibacillus woosongensis]|uniref:Recombinase family protein n=1 Tax=Paenibacillus woosongensis TaxID=307580 RepID=A0A7X2Z0X9_9BACL|nr:recombinase family protein [Paenibacillus woosongensis]MUG45472.1 recombinase family protein [Paenibacillus woosongensis]